jgi:hypothetical protein
VNLLALFFFLGLAFSSLYVFPSGNPQPADFLLLSAAAGLLLSHSDCLRGMTVLWPMVALAVWVAIVSSLWTALYPQGNFLKPPLFYIFNLLLMFAVVNFSQFSMIREGFLPWVSRSR